MKPKIKFSPAQEKAIQMEMMIQKGIAEVKAKRKFKWDSGAVKIIKEQIAERKKLNLHNGNDWKVAYLESKLTLKSTTLSKLRKLFK